MAGTPNPTTTPGPAAIPPGAVPAPEAPWYAGWKDESLRGAAENNKWADPEAVARDAVNAQKLLGVPRDELVRLPKPDAKPEDWDAFYSRIGRPAKPEDYKIEQVEGGEAFATQMKAVFHQAGVPQAAVDKIAPAFNQFIKSQVEAQDREQEQRETLDLANLHREWPGEVFTQREEMARRAVHTFIAPIAGEKTAETLGQIEDAIGTSAFLKLFANIGEKLSEGKFVDGGNRPTMFGTTPAAAKARLEELKGDREWGKKVLANPKGPEALEWNRLMELAVKS